MTISDELEQINTIFIDTAPVIYYIEAHPEFGPLVKEVVNSLALKTIDSIQLSTAVDVGADVFLTNDKKLKKIKEIKVLLLNDYLSGRPTGV